MVNRGNLLVGVTGGMGSGKSTAAGFFEECGYRRLDSDQLIRDEVWPMPDVVAAVRERWGDGLFDSSGRVRRDRVAAIVFQDEAALAWLEDLLHPRLLGLLRRTFLAATDTAFIVEVPLLFEKELEIWFDFTVCVTIDFTSQLRRLEQRGISPELARQRLAKQLPLARKCELADFVLLNDGSPGFLREQVAVLADRLLKSKPTRPPGRIHGSAP